MLSAFPGKENLEKRRAWPLSNSIVNSTVQYIDSTDRDRRIAHYTLKHLLLTSYLEKRESRVKFSRSRAALDVLVEMIDAMIILDRATDEELYLLGTGFRYLLLCGELPEQTVHNDFKVLKDSGSGFFILLFGFEAICILGCSASYTYVHYPMDENIKLAQLFRLKENASPVSSILVGYRYL